MNEPAQNFANHKKTPVSLIVNSVVLIAAALLAGAGIALGLHRGDFGLGGALVGLGAVAAALGGVSVAMMARIYSLCLQDRIIRLEMRLRLRETLPAELHPRLSEITLKQLIALRFASEAELVELVPRVLDKSLVTSTEIKQQIRDWQADHLRV